MLDSTFSGGFPPPVEQIVTRKSKSEIAMVYGLLGFGTRGNAFVYSAGPTDAHNSTLKTVEGPVAAA